MTKVSDFPLEVTRGRAHSTPPPGASFGYDALGRRVGKSIFGATTNYLYDGVNVVQEIQNAAPSPNLLSGLGVDESLCAGFQHLC